MRSGVRRLVRSVKDRIPPDPDLVALYREVHDLDRAREITSTAAAFARQWSELPTGEYLLSDPWFKANVDRILVEQELLLPLDWFPGKRVLDAGCGNGRWSYGLAKLGADLTSVDIGAEALDETRAALEDVGLHARFVQSPLEELDVGTFDLVFCWGVLHHVVEFNRALDRLTSAVGPDGALYLYLYGRDSFSLASDLRLFRERLAYNVDMDDARRRTFLLKKARGDPNRTHNMHDIYAPMINRRFTFEEVTRLLAVRGFTDVVRTIDHTELFIRATRPGVTLPTLQAKRPPYWFQGRHL